MRLVFETGSLAGKGVELPYGETIVGRAEDCQLVLGDPGVSGHHAEIRVLGESHATIEDLGSRNGTFADGERVTGIWNLTPGTEVRFGTVVAMLTEAARPPESRGGSRLPIVVATVALLLAAAVPPARSAATATAARPRGPPARRRRRPRRHRRPRRRRSRARTRSGAPAARPCS